MKGKTLSGIGKKISEKTIKNKQTMDLLFKLPKKLVIETKTTGQVYNLAIIYQEGEVWANYFADTVEGMKTLTMDIKPSKTLHDALLKLSKHLKNDSTTDLQ